MYQLVHLTNNNAVISRHRTLAAAEKAEAVWHRAVRRRYPNNSCRTVVLRDGEDVDTLAEFNVRPAK